MPRGATGSTQRPRISVDVQPELRCHHLRMAAATRDVSVGEYVREAIEERVKADLGTGAEEMPALRAASDPVLAELWDNDSDAVYDRL